MAAARANPSASARRSTARGARTREEILHTAAQLASVEGLENLSLGRLAAELGRSKSGLFAHFGSLTELQLAIVEQARAIFSAEVLERLSPQSRGLVALEQLCDAWLGYIERGVFAGGCFFMAISTEFDSRPGPVREKLALIMGYWLRNLERRIREAQELGELPTDIEPAQLAFEIHALGMGANWAFQLFDDPQALQRARLAIRERVAQLAGGPIGLQR
ncbi:TetR/AcrR family transcriptional regulator [Gloeobacter violaceus]|uniref:TetR family transcriptional regulatory protein n=1 Tax=Gloeobacter violaceus (strain ATCC 29082 / PCC 7421) TaxID=251221 RepID=Q7NNC6_GLOVI|nr:TetR family transcriptional regulator [Gloeobacter violaceus]BAC88426.1 TetR family transcriptional regulatory protein [Gloeobacter violaceus PCC 7421]